MLMGAETATQFPFVARSQPFLYKLLRRKHVDTPRCRAELGGGQLAKNLTVLQLIPIGVGSTIGAGVYVLIGTVARERSGPALTISFLIAGIAAALSAFCYAELSSRCPSAGSAYHYSYICVGEGIAWLIGWALILEYTVGGSAAARGISPNLAALFGGEDNLPVWLTQKHIPGTEVVVDPCAGLLVILVTLLLCSGVKESAMVQAGVTSANVCVLIFVIVAGTVVGFNTSWPGYKQINGYLPFGINGMLGGAGTVFFAYVGFDNVASLAEEVKHPQHDLPIGIGLSLFICGSLYMLVSVVIVGIVPYYEMDVNTPIATAFAKQGMPWAMYIVAVGAVAALSSTLMGSLLPQPRILMAMARDGLLPPLFSKINKSTAVPVNGMVATGVIATLLAFIMDVDQLSGMVSFGTLLAFVVVGISLLVLRYVPPMDVPILPPEGSLPASDLVSCSVTPHLGNKSVAIPGTGDDHVSVSSKSVVSEEDGENEDEEYEQLFNSLESIDITIQNPLLTKETSCEGKSKEENRRWAAAMSILAVCIGAVFIAISATIELLPSWVRWTLALIGIFIFGSGSIVLALLEQDEGQHTFGHSGGFICPFIPWLPVASILINVYLLADLGLNTWLRVSIWLILGASVYLFYGVCHSSLAVKNATVPTECGTACSPSVTVD